MHPTVSLPTKPKTKAPSVRKKCCFLLFFTKRKAVSPPSTSNREVGKTHLPPKNLPQNLRNACSSGGGPTFTNCPLCKAFQKVCWSLSGDGKDLCNDLQSCPWGLRLLDTGRWPERKGGGLCSGDSWRWGGRPNPVPSPMTRRSCCL